MWRSPSRYPVGAYAWQCRARTLLRSCTRPPGGHGSGAGEAVDHRPARSLRCRRSGQGCACVAPAGCSRARGHLDAVRVRGQVQGAGAPPPSCRALVTSSERPGPHGVGSLDCNRRCEIFDEVPGAAAHARDVAAHRVHHVTLVSHRLRPVLHRCSRRINFLSNARKSMSARVDIGWCCGYGFSRSPERQKGPADTNCRAAVCSCSAQDGAVVEFRSQGCCRTATGLTTGPGGPQ